MEKLHVFLTFYLRLYPIKPTKFEKNIRCQKKKVYDGVEFKAPWQATHEAGSNTADTIAYLQDIKPTLILLFER